MLKEKSGVGAETGGVGRKAEVIAAALVARMGGRGSVLKRGWEWRIRGRVGRGSGRGDRSRSVGSILVRHAVLAESRG